MEPAGTSRTQPGWHRVPRARTERVRLGTLAIIDGLLSGEPFAFGGDHYRFGPMTFRPRPVQRPRVPVRVVGAWPHEQSRRRAIRWDGLVVQGSDAGGRPSGTPSDLAEITTWIRRVRAADGHDGPFEIIACGTAPADDPAAASAAAHSAAEAGATWWVESNWTDMSVAAVRSRIVVGPPREGDRSGPR